MSDTKTPFEYAEEILKDKKPYALKIAKELRKDEGNRELLDQAAQCLEDDCDYLKTIAESIKASQSRESQGDSCCRPLAVNYNTELRELLSKAIKRLELVTGCDMHFFHPDATSCDGKTSMGECNHLRTCELIFESRKALAKPPRNSADNNQVPVVPSVPEVPSVPSTIANLRNESETP